MLYPPDKPIPPEIIIMPRRDFTDERVSKKQRQIDKQRAEQEKDRKKARKEVKQALKQSKEQGIGWTTRDGQKI